MAVADPETSERGGPRNIKYKPPRIAAIFFLTYFYRPGGGAWPPWPPPDPLLHGPYNLKNNKAKYKNCLFIRSEQKLAIKVLKS